VAPKYHLLEHTYLWQEAKLIHFGEETRLASRLKPRLLHFSL